MRLGVWSRYIKGRFVRHDDDLLLAGNVVISNGSELRRGSNATLLDEGRLN